MSYKVYFVGLVCFYRERCGRQVLVPDGRKPGGNIAPHFPSVLVDPGAVEDASGWPESDDVNEGIYALPESWISFSGADREDGSLDTSDHEGQLPQLRQFDSRFEIEPETAQTVVRLRICNGKLSAHMLPKGSAVISQLIVPHDDSIILTVTPRNDDDGGPRTLRLAPGTEIVVGNMADGGVYNRNQSAHGHFKIYEKLSVNQVELKDPDEESIKLRATILPALKTEHWLFRRATSFHLSVSCSNTGCC